LDFRRNMADGPGSEGNSAGKTGPYEPPKSATPDLTKTSLSKSLHAAPPGEAMYDLDCRAERS
jgi:hypothetical protein